MQRILTVIDKEWSEVFKNRLVLFTVAFMPVLFTALPLFILYVTNQGSGTGLNAGASESDLPPSILKACGNLPLTDCLQIYLLNQFLLIFMMMPLIIPVAIAAYSIVGEKTTRSLEPLLATPIRTTELLAAKSLAAAIPGILATWICFIVFLILAPIVGARPAVLLSLLNGVWLLAVFVAGPLMAVLAVNFALIVSSRVNDPRTAEQLSAVVIMPILAIVLGQIAGLIVLNVQFMLVAISLLTMIDVGLIYLGARLFQRETILTKWK
jgi:ABC-2 type transport system permease protein